MREKLEKFIRENEVKIGEDFQLTTPNYYASLGEGFYHYFSTFKDKKNVYHFIVDKEDFNKSHGFEIAGMYDNIVLSILSFHRFLELYIKDVLRRINPYLAVKINPGIEDIFNFPSQIIPAENYHTIEFSESLKRLKKAFELNKLKGGIYQKILNHLMFLNDPKIILDLEKINQWRNRLIHNGNKLPNFILFEFLISQQIIPIVTAIYKAEKNSLMGFEPHYFKTLTGINIIEKLNNANCKFSLTDIENKNYIIPKLFLIGHLKELGRANYSQDFYMMKNIKHDEPGYDNPIGRNVRFAKLEEKNEHFFKRTKCNCCNAESLVVYKRKIDDFFQIGTDFISWFRCFNCDYSLNMNMFDPFEFGLSEEPIFPTC